MLRKWSSCIREIVVNLDVERKEYGLWINEEPMKYNSKADFEADARRRFPFIEYMEVMIHDQDHNQFIGSLTRRKISEIISKAIQTR